MILVPSSNIAKLLVQSFAIFDPHICIGGPKFKFFDFRSKLSDHFFYCLRWFLFLLRLTFVFYCFGTLLQALNTVIPSILVRSTHNFHFILAIQGVLELTKYLLRIHLILHAIKDFVYKLCRACVVFELYAFKVSQLLRLSSSTTVNVSQISFVMKWSAMKNLVYCCDNYKSDVNSCSCKIIDIRYANKQYFYAYSRLHRSALGLNYQLGTLYFSMFIEGLPSLEHPVETYQFCNCQHDSSNDQDKLHHFLMYIW